MCGRYATTQTSATLHQAFEIDLANSFVELEADYNMAPTKLAPVVIGRRDDDAPPGAPQRELLTARWGLVPSWAKDPSIGSRMINARVETAHEKPAFRKAWAQRRCLLPADGYFEWYTGEAEPGQKATKQPFFLTPKDGGILPMAGMYELWKSPEGEWIWTCTILTTDATDELGHLHDRTPMTVTDQDAWLDPAVKDPRELLIPAMVGGLVAFPVSKAVGNVKNSGPELIKPLTNGEIATDETSTLF